MDEIVKEKKEKKNRKKSEVSDDGVCIIQVIVRWVREFLTQVQKINWILSLELKLILYPQL